MKKKQLLFVLTFTVVNILFAQDTFLKKDKEIILSMGPISTKLINSNIDKDEYKKVNNQMGFNASFSYCKYINNRIGFRIGFEYSNYKQTVYQNGLFEQTNLIDKDSNIYDLWLNSEMTYTANLKYIDLPIMFHLLLGESKQFYCFIDAGIINGLLLGGKYTKKGSIENMGKYATSNPFFDVVSQDNSYYDYKKNYFDKEYTDTYKTYNLSFRASIGIVATITDRIYLRVAPEFTKGISDITSKDDTGKDYITIFGNKQGYQSTKTFSLGLNVGVVFDL